MKIYVDIDETICFYDGERNYPNAEPNMANIEKGIDWLETTANQLDEWGCQYHELSVGEKPAYDLLICDKTKRIEEI